MVHLALGTCLGKKRTALGYSMPHLLDGECQGGGGDDGVGTKAPHDEPSRDLHGGDRCQGRDGNTQALDQLHVSDASAIPLIQDSVTQEGNILL